MTQKTANPRQHALSHPSRRLVARECAEVARGLAEIARATGIANGPLSGLLKRMVADGVLQADGQPGARGTLYLLLPKWRAILDEPIANHNVGEIKRDQRLLRIKGRPRAIASVIADTGLAAETMWSVRLNGDTDWLLAFDPITSPLMVDRLLAALEQAEVDCARSVAEDVMSGDEFRRYAAAVLDATAQGAGPAKAMRS